MKRYSLLILSFLALTASAIEKPITPPTLTATTKTQSKPSEYYSIQSNYPVVSDISNAKTINRLITNQIDQITTEFKRNIPSAKNLLATYPNKESAPVLSDKSNTLNINYKVMANTHGILSLRFEILSQSYGAAKSNTDFEVFNYDLQRNKKLSLDNQFKSKSKYLQFFSTYSTEELTKKLSTPPDHEGTAAVATNFRNWNITDKGIMITFPTYQITTGDHTYQEILIPYDAMQDEIAPNSALNRFKQS